MVTKPAVKIPKLVEEVLINSGKVLLYGALWRLSRPLHLFSVPLKEYTLNRILDLMVTKLALVIEKF
jgi:hypothetical protein